MPTFLNDSFPGSGSLVASTGSNGETYSSLAGDYTIVSGGCFNTSTADLVYCNNKFGATVEQQLTTGLNIKSTITGQQVGIVGWFDASYYAVFYYHSSTLIEVYAGASLLGSFAATFADGDVLGLNLSVGSQNVTKNGSSIQTFTDTSVTPPAPGAAKVMLWSSGAAGTSTTGIHYTFLKGDYSAATLTNTAPTLSAQSTTSVTLTSGPAGGTPPYTYKWYASTTPNFTAGGGNVIGGATSATLVRSLSSTPEYIRSEVTDSIPNSVVSYERLILAARDNILSVFRIGDSTSKVPAAPNTCMDVCCAELASRGGFTRIDNQNLAVPGSDTGTWNTGGSNMNAFDAAVAACTNRFVISISLGVNDAQAHLAAASFGTALSGIITHVQSLTNASAATCLAVFVDYPGWREPGFYSSIVGTFDEVYATYVMSYLSQITSLVNGTTIRIGDNKSLFTEAEYPLVYMLQDGDPGSIGRIHPSTLGAESMGVNIAQAIWDYLYPPASGGGGSSVFGG